MKRFSSSVVASVVLLGGLFSVIFAGSALGTERFFDRTWKLNVAKSKCAPGPAPKSMWSQWSWPAKGSR